MLTMKALHIYYYNCAKDYIHRTLNCKTQRMIVYWQRSIVAPNFRHKFQN